MGSCGLERAARAGPDQIPVQAQANPVRCPDWARTRQTGHARTNPTRASAGLAIWEQPSILCSIHCTLSTKKEEISLLGGGGYLALLGEKAINCEHSISDLFKVILGQI